MLIAGCAAFFSVYGIGLLFSGAIVASMVMASSLELGKLVTTSWLFRYWNVANRLMKIYMIVAVLVLMVITSLGIFGYLTAAFQKSSLEHELSNTKISTLELQKNNELKKLDSVKSNIDKLLSLRASQETRLNETLKNTLIARNPIQLQNMQNQINDQISDLNKQIETENLKLKETSEKSGKIDDEIFKLKIENSQKKDITTFKFVADEFNTDIRHVVKWFIIVLITVFDPLAVVLLLAYNMSSNTRNSTEREYELYSKDRNDVEKVVSTTTENQVVSQDIKQPDVVIKQPEVVQNIEESVPKTIEPQTETAENNVVTEKPVEKAIETVDPIIETAEPSAPVVKKPKNKIKGVRGLFSF